VDNSQGTVLATFQPFDFAGKLAGQIDKAPKTGG
jgi:hypothetical protein